jgi:hypothetical protein
LLIEKELKRKMADAGNLGEWETRAQGHILVALSGAALDRIRLMKTLFLVWYRSDDGEHGPFYFEPYLYGPCSFEVYRELDKLQSRGLIVQAPHPIAQRSRYHLTAAGRRVADTAAEQLGAKLSRELRDTARWSAELSFGSLLSAVYSEAPEFVARSIARSV